MGSVSGAACAAAKTTPEEARVLATGPPHSEAKGRVHRFDDLCLAVVAELSSPHAPGSRPSSPTTPTFDLRRVHAHKTNYPGCLAPPALHAVVDRDELRGYGRDLRRNPVVDCTAPAIKTSSIYVVEISDDDGQS